MEKELFIKTIEAIKKQNEYDISVSKNLSMAFPNSFSANLLPDNHFLSNALLEVLQVAMCDNDISVMGQSWIEYFCWELNFGENNIRLKSNNNGIDIPLNNAGELWEYLNERKKQSIIIKLK